MAAGKQYVWAIDAMSDGAGGMLFAQLLTLVDGCVAPEPTRRLTVPALLESLTTLQRNVAATSVGASSVAVSPPLLPTAKTTTAAAAVAPMYDVLAIIDAMESLSIDPAIVAAVANAVGTSMTSTLDSLVANKVPVMQIAAVRKVVAPPHAATTSV